MNTSLEKVILKIVLSSLLLLPWEANSDFYKYTDKSGVTHFVDSPDKIPAQYRGGLEVRQTRPDHLNTKQKSNLMEDEEQRRQKMISDYLAGGEQVETRVNVVNGQVLVPVVLGYGGREAKATLVLDTGASIVLLYRPMANQLAVRSDQQGKARVAGGQFIDIRMTKLSYIKIGGIVKNDIEVAFTNNTGPDSGFDGLLGMNFLQGFEYSVDLGRQVITWKKP